MIGMLWRSVGVFCGCTLVVGSMSARVHAGQAVCYAIPGSGEFVNVFSVGEVRASLLSEENFQELNGAEWVLMDGRSLPVGTALTERVDMDAGDYGFVIPDGRGALLRMAGVERVGEVVTGDGARDSAEGGAGDVERGTRSIAVNFFVKICECRTSSCR